MKTIALPIHHAHWKVGPQPTPLSLRKFASEEALEDRIIREPDTRPENPCAT